MKNQKNIYLDNAAATPLDPRVLKAMLPFFDKTYANPSSLHSPGQAANKAVMQARKSIASILNGHADEIIFTSGGTESDNLAIRGVLEAAVPKLGWDGSTQVPHVVTTAIEHHAVLEPLMYLQKIGAIKLTIIKPKKDGVVSVQDVLDAIKHNTVLVSIMYANNEIGTIQPIAEIGKVLLRWRKENNTALPYFHSDACQAAGYLDLNVEKLHVDLLTLNAGKIYGPKGVGLLFVRRGTKLAPITRGGGQERGLRSGTENTPGIVGMAKALELVQKDREKESKRLSLLRNRLIDGLLRLPKSRLNGDADQRLPNNVNISFLDIEGEAAMLYLDAKGIACSTGSACASSSLDPSHVILALGMSYEAAHGSLRFTFGKSTTKSDVDYVVSVMPGIVEMLRKISPVTLDMSRF
ncbi:MAG: aminotransferase class V-fold PLP-dependent enzyme [Patescibacteria group bacterium]|nr:aminotransferase class V-fold PLP-dependent enzyme [Patescibacteria group bacterium]